MRIRRRTVALVAVPLLLVALGATELVLRARLTDAVERRAGCLLPGARVDADVRGPAAALALTGRLGGLDVEVAGLAPLGARAEVALTGVDPRARRVDAVEAAVAVPPIALAGRLPGGVSTVRVDGDRLVLGGAPGPEVVASVTARGNEVVVVPEVVRFGPLKVPAERFGDRGVALPPLPFGLALTGAAVEDGAVVVRLAAQRVQAGSPAAAGGCRGGT